MVQHLREFIRQRLSTYQLAQFGLSLLIAIVLWGWVTQLQDPLQTQRYAEIPITPPELAGTIQIVTSLPRATVSIADVSSRLDDVARADIHATLDASRIDGPGTYQLPVIVEIDSQVREVRVSPDTISVQVEEEVSRNFPLTVENQMLADDARRVVDTRPDVSEVTVTGTAFAVDRIDRVVLPVSVQGRTSSFAEMLEPYAVDEDGQRIQEVQIIPVHVRTEVELEARGKTVSIVPQVVGTPREGFVVQQQVAVPSTIIVDGPAEALDTLLFVNTEPVDITDATESISRTVSLEDLPDGVELIEPPENRIEVRVSIGTSGGTANTIPDMDVTVENLGDGLHATVDPSNIDINVSASSDVLTELTSEEVSVRVDVSGLGPGVYTLEPEVELPEEVHVVQLDPEQVVVLVTDRAATPPAADSENAGDPVVRTTGD
jgi:YbbR domain-containing protein